MSRRLLFLALLAGLVAGGCTRIKPNRPMRIATGTDSPVRMQIHKQALSTELNRILLLSPLGIEDKESQTRFQQALFGAMQRRFSTPVGMVPADSAYAPYVREGNLVHSDGTINASEIAIIGKLMGCSHVVCPHASEFRPYHPQRIALRLLVVCTETGQLCAELSCVLDAKDNDVFEYFIAYCEASGIKGNADDLRFRIKSPDIFQAFAADLCSTVAADRLEPLVKELRQEEENRRAIAQQQELERQQQRALEKQRELEMQRQLELHRQVQLEKEREEQLKEQQAKEKALQEQLEEQQRLEQQRLEQQREEQIAKEKALQKQLEEQQRLEQKRLEKEREEQIAKEKALQKQLEEQQRLEQKRLEQEREEQIAKEKALQKQLKEQQRLEQRRLEQEREEQEAKEKAQLKEQQRLEQEPNTPKRDKARFFRTF